MKIKQKIFICLLLIVFAGCVEVVSAEENPSSAVLTTTSLVPITINVEEFNSYFIFKYRDTGGAIEALSAEEAAQVKFDGRSFVSYEPDGVSLFDVGLATIGKQQYVAVVDPKNLKGQVSKGGIGKIRDGVTYYKENPPCSYKPLDLGNWKSITNVLVKQRKILPTQGPGIVLIKVFGFEEKTE